MSKPARDFVAGLSSRHDAAAVRLRRAYDERPLGFAPGDLIARIEAAYGSEGTPRSYAPADPGSNPTQGWDPLDPSATGGFVDAAEVARQAAYDDGYAAGRADQAGGDARDRALLGTIVDAVKADDRIDRERIARQLRQTVLLLVGKLIGEAGVSEDLLAARVVAAADLLADAAESAILRVHPADVALLAGKLPATIFAVGDAKLERGSFVLEAASTIVEDGPALWIDQLTAALDKIAVPPTGRSG